MRHQNYFVYILTNADRDTVLYIGVTNGFERRASEHSLGFGSSFAWQYNAHKLIYFETYPDPVSAIAREKQLKRWRRSKKEALIARSNPEWRDLLQTCTLYVRSVVLDDATGSLDSTPLRSG